MARYLIDVPFTCLDEHFANVQLSLECLDEPI